MKIMNDLSLYNKNKELIVIKNIITTVLISLVTFTVYATDNEPTSTLLCAKPAKGCSSNTIDAKCSKLACQAKGCNSDYSSGKCKDLKDEHTAACELADDDCGDTLPSSFPGKGFAGQFMNTVPTTASKDSGSGKPQLPIGIPKPKPTFPHLAPLKKSAKAPVFVPKIKALPTRIDYIMMRSRTTRKPSIIESSTNTTKTLMKTSNGADGVNGFTCEKVVAGYWECTKDGKKYFCTGDGTGCVIKNENSPNNSRIQISQTDNKVHASKTSPKKNRLGVTRLQTQSQLDVFAKPLTARECTWLGGTVSHTSDSSCKATKMKCTGANGRSACITKALKQ